MNVDHIVHLAVSSLRAAMPEALYQGSLIKKTRAFDASTCTNEEVDEVVTPVEVVFDKFTFEELSGGTIKSTQVKLIIIADDVKDVDFYDLVHVLDADYRIINKVDVLIGSNAVLFTIIAEKQ